MVAAGRLEEIRPDRQHQPAKRGQVTGFILFAKPCAKKIFLNSEGTEGHTEFKFRRLRFQVWPAKFFEDTILL